SWEISLPEGSTNKGITFAGDTVELVLTFVLDARIIGATDAALVSFGITGPSKQDVIANMASQGSALNGWDVVFNMGLTEINRSLGAQYEDLKKSSAFSNQIKIESKTQRRAKSCSITRFEVEYGYPKLEFLENNSERVALEMQILKGSF